MENQAQAPCPSKSSGCLLKIAIIGVGAIGTATAHAYAMRDNAHPIVLQDINRTKVGTGALDMAYGI